VPDASEKNTLDLAAKIDSLLAGLGEDFSKRYRSLLTVFEYGAPLLGPVFKRFTQMSSEEKDRYLSGWERSSLAFKRMGFQALKRTALSAYYGSPESWPSIGYRGPWLEQGYPPDYAGKGIQVHS